MIRGTMAVVTVAALGLWLPTLVRADVPGYAKFTKVVERGAVPKAGDGDLEVVGINEADHVAFVTEPANDDVPGTGGEVLYFWDGAKIIGPLVRSDSVWNPAGLNNQDQLVAIMQQGDDKHNETFLFDMKNGGAKKVLTKPGMPVGNSKIGDDGSRSSAAINQRGEVTTTVDLDGSQAVVLVAPDGKFTVIAGKGTKVGSKTLDQATYGALNDNGQVVFTDQPPDQDGNSVYLYDKGTITAIAGPGTDVAGAGKIANAIYPYINNSGDIVFRGTLQGDPVPQGLFLYSAATKKVTALAKTGSDLPGGGKFTQVEGTRRHSAVINNNGLVASLIYIDANSAGLLLVDTKTGKMSVPVRIGTDLPGIGKVEKMGHSLDGFAGFNCYLNDNGDVAFGAQVGGKEAIFLATVPKPAAPVAGE